MTRIESRPSKSHQYGYEFVVDFEGEEESPQIKTLLGDLSNVAEDINVLSPVTVPWFPRKISDLDSFSAKTLDAGAELESDHPGFSDKVYRERRERIVANATTYKHGMQIPRVDYSDDETATWGAVYEKLQKLYPKYACKQFNNILPLLEHNVGYAPDNIPQQQDVSDFLRECTGFTMRPVTGLLSARDFLNALAFRVFFSTQYIRHHSRPLYTPEPDVCHELLGHAPMFADEDFADFSQDIGLASLGASDADIKRLATCYWFTVEFGLVKQQGELRSYGAGLLSSFGEMEYSCAPYRPAGGTDERPEYLPWDPNVAGELEYPITTYQPTYFVAESMTDVKSRMRSFCEQISRPFHVRYHPLTQTVQLDRTVQRTNVPE